jgi:hypothetical protein
MKWLLDFCQFLCTFAANDLLPVNSRITVDYYGSPKSDRFQIAINAFAKLYKWYKTHKPALNLKKTHFSKLATNNKTCINVATKLFEIVTAKFLGLKVKTLTTQFNMLCQADSHS